jgi:hypothetical protein
MKRVLTATCLAASFAVGLAAQSTGTAGAAATTSQDPQAAGQRGGGPRTVTGCLRAGDTAGSFMLTDVQGLGGRGQASGTGATAGGATAGAAGATAGTTAGGAAQGGPPMSVMLTADASVDLKSHVGHKVEVTGTLAGGRRGGAAGGGTTGTATGSTASGTTAGGTTAGGTATGGTATGGTATGTGTGSTSGTGTAGVTGTGQGGGRNMGPRNMTVTSLRMISESCS